MLVQWWQKIYPVVTWDSESLNIVRIQLGTAANPSVDRLIVDVPSMFTIPTFC